MKKILYYISIYTVLFYLTSCQKIEYDFSLKNNYFFSDSINIGAHRGVWIDGAAPENSIHSLFLAKKYGFNIVEFDVRNTLDKRIVVIHDGSMNRTFRNASDYSTITKDIYIEKNLFEYLRSNFVLISEKKEYRTPIPTLEEFLVACKKYNLFPILHIQMSSGNEKEVFDLAKKHFIDEWCCFSSSLDVCLTARSMSNCLVLYSNNNTSDRVFEILSQIGGWCGFSTTKSNLLTDDLCKKLRSNGYEIQSSLPSLNSSVLMIRNKVTILLSDYAININSKANITDLKKNYTDFECNGTVKNKILYLSENQFVKKNLEESVMFGGVNIKITFKGSLIVKINDKNFNLITRDDLGTDQFSLRFFDKKPSFSITSMTDTEIYDISVKIASF